MRHSVRWLLLGLAAPALALGAAPAADNPTFTGEKVGTVSSSQIKEASGLVASRKNAGVFWVHNDSGDSPRLFALTSSGKHLGIYPVSNARAADWEDIAIGPGPSSGVDYLYIGDIGDNGRSRSSLTIYRVPEPSVSASQSPVSQTLPGTAALRVVYPDGKFDCETLMVDPANADIYLVTKHGGSGASRVYRYPAPHNPAAVVTLQYVRTVQFGSSSSTNGERATTGGEISPNRKEILIRTYKQSHLWPRLSGQTIGQALGNARTVKTLISERQGEAICFSPDGIDYYTVSEGSYQPIYRYRRTSGFPSDGDPVTSSFQSGVSPSSSYGDAVDATLSEHDPNLHLGGSLQIEADGDEPSGTGRDRAALARWSVRSIPAGSLVQSVQITLHVTNPSAGQSYEIYALARSWVEGEVTWNQRRAGAAWETAGARGASDRHWTVLGRLAPTSTGTYTVPLNSAGVARVQAWVDNPDSNYGFIFSNSSSADGMNAASKEDGTPARRPRLTVTYVAP